MLAFIREHVRGRLSAASLHDCSISGHRRGESSTTYRVLRGRRAAIIKIPPSKKGQGFQQPSPRTETGIAGHHVPPVAGTISSTS
jgi:hypothetical protein